MKNKKKILKMSLGIILLIKVSFAIIYFSNFIFAEERVAFGEHPMEYYTCAHCCYEIQGFKEEGIDWDDRYNFMTECPSEENWTQTSSDPNIWKDNVTGLYWTAEQSVNINWQDSIDLCLGLNDISYGGRTGWRLPTKDELMQLSPSSHSYAYKGGHDLNGNTDIGENNYFWSRNEGSWDTAGAWTVYLASGNVGINTKTTTVASLGVRCVSRD